MVSIAVDDAGGFRQIAEHLVRQGYCHILYRANPRSPISSARRLKVFLTVSAGLQMTVIVLPTPELSPALSLQEVAFLQAPAGQRPTAAVCWLRVTHLASART